MSPGDDAGMCKGRGGNLEVSFVVMLDEKGM
jgi:hypothetical protein